MARDASAIGALRLQGNRSPVTGRLLLQEPPEFHREVVREQRVVLDDEGQGPLAVSRVFCGEAHGAEVSCCATHCADDAAHVLIWSIRSCLCFGEVEAPRDHARVLRLRIGAGVREVKALESPEVHAEFPEPCRDRLPADHVPGHVEDVDRHILPEPLLGKRTLDLLDVGAPIAAVGPVVLADLRMPQRLQASGDNLRQVLRGSPLSILPRERAHRLVAPQLFRPLPTIVLAWPAREVLPRRNVLANPPLQRRQLEGARLRGEWRQCKRCRGVAEGGRGGRRKGPDQMGGLVREYGPPPQRLPQPCQQFTVCANAGAAAP
mmetsp:Transcript_24865/g.66045  ORF Transcript_24865/g.66045 Transcript_24865/m.66045 type:complete len:320 (+) Transcript_24865:875-1834(+)